MHSEFDLAVDAIVNRKFTCATDLLSHSPSLAYAINADGDNLLHIACWQKSIDIIPQLIAFGCDVNGIGCYGRSPLHYAVHEGTAITPAICRILIDSGASASIKDCNGYTPLEWAHIECPEYAELVYAILNAQERMGQIDPI